MRHKILLQPGMQKWPFWVYEKKGRFGFWRYLNMLETRLEAEDYINYRKKQLFG